MAPKLEEKGRSEDGKVEISEKFKQILKSDGITDSVSEVIIDDAGLKGEGFVSLTQYVTVKFDDPGKKPLNLFVKAQTGNPSHTEFVTELMAFEKEARFLTDYCRAAKEMCKLKGRPGFVDFYPKCYYGDSEMIVMENLVLDKGYALKSKEDRQTLEDAKTALKTLGKHHALGHVMIQENGGPEKFFKKFPELNVDSYDKPFIISLLTGQVNNGLDSNLRILEKNCVPGSKEAADKLRELSGKPILMLLEALKIRGEEQENFLVLNHGDYWNNNMMFLVDPTTEKNVHHVAIDFQVMRYNSPALDLTYYFFNSVQADVRRNHLLELLTVYKDTLNETTEDFGHPINLTLDQIFKMFREKIGFGFWFGFAMNVGPGVGLLKDIDVSKIDMKDWGMIMGQLLNKWVDENPEKGKETAEEIVQLVKEYEQLKI